MNKRLLASVLTVAIILTLTGCPLFMIPEGDGPLIGMVFDQGGLGDGSFNDGAYAGLEQARDELGVEIMTSTVASSTEFQAHFEDLADQGAELVFGVGFLSQSGIEAAAASRPDTHFAAIDVWIDPSTAPSNLTGITFREEEAGYLAGVVAGLLTSTHADVSTKLNTDTVIGAVIGLDIGPTQRFFAGYEMGATDADTNVTVQYDVVGSFSDETAGENAADTMIAAGADIIFNIAGLTGIGALQAADTAGVLGIGVDIDQNGLYPDTVVTSAVKRLDNAVYYMVEDYLNGSIVGADTITYGLADDGVGLAPFHGFDQMIPQAVLDAVAQAEQDIIAGNITIPQEYTF